MNEKCNIKEMIMKANSGDSLCCYKLAEYYLSNSKKEHNKAFNLLMKGIQIDHNPYCYYGLGECYLKGYHVTKDELAANVFYEKAIEGLNKVIDSDKNASFILGIIYSVSTKFFDSLKAVEMFRKNYEETLNPMSKSELDKFEILMSELF